MKCKACGNNLSIDDAKCPYCGTENPYAKKHRSDMKYFKKRFEKTREDVYLKTNHFTEWTVKITIVAVLITLNILSLFLYTRSWNISRYFENSKSTAKIEVHRDKLNELEKERDYIGFVKYYDVHSLYSNDLYDTYDVIYRLCDNFTYVYKYLMELRNLDDPKEIQSKLEDINDSLDYMYQQMVPDEYDDPACYDGIHRETILDLKNDLSSLFVTYCHIPKEDLLGFDTLSKARRQIVMERGLGLYEE